MAGEWAKTLKVVVIDEQACANVGAGWLKNGDTGTVIEIDRGGDYFTIHSDKTPFYASLPTKAVELVVANPLANKIEENAEYHRQRHAKEDEA